MGTVSIINAGVFDGVSEGLADGPVHVADGRIVSVGGRPQPADQVIDARGGTVLPGLLILGGNISGDPSVLWSPDSQRTILQDGRVIAGSGAPR